MRTSSRYPLLLPLFLALFSTARLNAQTAWHKLGTPANGPVTGIVAKDNAIVVSVLDKGIFHSTDGGATWSAAGTGLPGAHVTSLAYCGAGSILAAVDDAVFGSLDNGATWTRLDKGMEGIGGPKTLVVSPEFRVLAATSNGVYSMPANGSAWSSFGMTGKKTKVAGEDCDGNYYVTMLDNALLRSTDIGGSWDKMPIADTVVTYQATQDWRVYAGGSSLFVSNDAGATWDFASRDIQSVSAIAIDHWNNVFVAASNGIFKSMDGGTSWKPWTDGLSAARVNNLVVDYNGNLYAGDAQGNIFAGKPSNADAKNRQAGIARAATVTPNPIRDRVVISFSLAQATRGTVDLYDASGRNLGTILSGEFAAGQSTIPVNLSGYPSGTYFCRFIAGDRTEIIPVAIER